MKPEEVEDNLDYIIKNKKVLIFVFLFFRKRIRGITVKLWSLL